MDWETDHKQFLQHFAVLSETFDKKCSKDLTRIYARALERFPIESVTRALDKAVETCRFFPKPVELIEFCSGGNIADQAEVEWGKVIGAIEHVGPYQSVVFDDATTMAVIETAGGWIQFCQDITFQNMSFKHKDFVSSYRAYKAQGIEKQGHLAGITERDNAVIGFNKPDPVMIGNEPTNQPVKQIEALRDALEKG